MKPGSVSVSHRILVSRENIFQPQKAPWGASESLEEKQGYAQPCLQSLPS